jgi:hypothetical protein
MTTLHLVLLLLLLAPAAPAVVGGMTLLYRWRFGAQPDPQPAAAPPVAAPFGPPGAKEHVGVILVHGIGDQRRFQHLDGELRDLIRALQRQETLGNIDSVTVDVTSSSAAAFHAEQDTWNAGPDPTVTVVVDHSRIDAQGGHRTLRTCLAVHEVWWADVNEPYSIAKQFRFWLWGLAVWAHPTRPASGLGSASHVAPPVVPDHWDGWDRLRLWMIGVFFVLLGYSIGTLSFLFTRVFGSQPPDILRTMANYISAVKLYNQERRFGPGLWWAREEFLDSVGEPPRVSVRRRMIRAIADVACNRYHRWYVLAHSQGSVVAFNGLMETAYAWPGYLDEKRWQRLRNCGMAGGGRQGMVIPQPPILPRRPNWALANEIAYRSRIFHRFRGLLTYGSPLEKFAGLWPALVPINRAKTFEPNIPWFNVYDPIDPVSGRLRAFQRQSPLCCPPAWDLGYSASWWLLLAHLKYLKQRKPSGDLAMLTTRWMLHDDPGVFVTRPMGRALGTWFVTGGAQQHRRCAVAWATWFVAAVALTLLGAIVLPVMWDAAVAAVQAIWDKVAEYTAGPLQT